MPIVAIKTEYAKEADELAARLADRGVILTHESKKLLRITVQGWYEEPPELGDGKMSKEKLKSLLWEIVDQVPEEEHILARKAKGKRAAFTDLFSGLFEGGYEVVGKLMGKGY